MYNKKVLSKAVSNLGSAKAPAKKRDKIYTNKEALSPFVSSEGYKQGPPPAGTNYRIPGDTLYNPTPYPIEAVSDNGIRKTLEPYDTTNTYFPGATHVDEYEMQKGGQKDSWGRSSLDPWYGFDSKTKKFTVKDQWGRKPGDEWYGFNPNAKQWTKGSKAKPLKFETPQILSAEEKYHDGPLVGIGQNINGGDGMMENLFEVVDPSGITSWDDIARSYEKEGMSPNTWLEIAGAIPLVGKAAKASKAGIHLAKYKGLDKLLYNMLPKSNAMSRTLKGAAYAGRGYDGYQVYDEANRPYALNNMGPKYEEGGDYYDDELTDDEIEELRRGGYIVEDLSDEEYKKGGEKKYSRSLSAKNRLFVENKLTKKPKSKKKKIFDPNAKYFQDGGVQCDDDGRCYETDQAQELLDKTHQTVTNALKIDQNVLDAVSQGYPANEVWQEYGVKTADQLTGDPYAYACANSATRGYAICDPNVKDVATLSNDRMKNAVAQGTTPFRKVGTYTGNKYEDVVKPGNLVSFMSGPFKHMVKNVGPDRYAQSTGSIEDWNDTTGVNWVPGNIPATVYEYAPYYNQIQALEEQARINPTYVPGTSSVGTLPIRPAEAIATQEAERVLPAVTQDLGMRQFGGIPTLPLNQNRQVLRDWLYGESIGMLQEADGGYMDLELSDEEIEAYRHGGYHVEEY